MVSIFRCCYVVIPTILSIVTVILGALAIAGSTSTKLPVSQTYLIRLNLTSVDLSAVLDNTTYTVSTSASELGLSDIYSFGLWSYCKGSSDNNGDYTVEYCSSPKPMYLFDPVSAFENDLSAADISLPSDVEKYISTAKVVSQIIFICSIIAVCAAFITALFTIFSFFSQCMSCLSVIIGVITFLSALIAAGAATGGFTLVKKYFNNAFDEYGISATLSNYWFYAFIWAAVGASLLTNIFNFFAVCCGTGGRHQRSRAIEEEPMMYYEEKVHH